MRCVEFLGPPGAGKSTLRRALLGATAGRAESAEAALLSALRRSRDDRLWRLFARLAPEPLARSFALPAFHRSRLRVQAEARYREERPGALEPPARSDSFAAMDPPARARALTWLRGTASSWQAISDSAPPDACVVFDEGFLQRSLTLFAVPERCELAPDEPALRDYLARNPSPALAVEVVASPGTCLARMARRGLPRRLRGASERRVEAFLAASVRHFGALAGLLEGRVAWVRVSGEEPPAQSATRLLAALPRFGASA